MANILIVDDKPYVRELLKEELLDEGYRVLTTDDAESAIKVVRCSRPDLVLLDLYDKGRDRWDILHGIKQQSHHLPVLIVTAYDSYGADPRLSQADGYVIKRMYFDDLKEKIAEVLNKKTPHQLNASGRPCFPLFNVRNRF